LSPPHDAFESLVTLNRALLIQHLLRGIAHDLRNHLQVFAFGAGGGQPPAVSARVEEAVEAMTERLDLMTRLGQMEFDPASTAELAAVATEVARLVDLMRTLPEGRLVMAPAPDGVRVALPPSALTQVLLNIVVNAREAGPPGRADAWVRFGDGRDNRLDVVIEDAGSADRRGAVELWHTTKDRRAHGGIGWFVTEGLLARYGGAIRRETAGGSRVVISLPLSGRG
jgi:C4-dicarboxylate-specific signal transduction histidine kinase